MSTEDCNGAADTGSLYLFPYGHSLEKPKMEIGRLVSTNLTCMSRKVIRKLDSFVNSDCIRLTDRLLSVYLVYTLLFDLILIIDQKKTLIIVKFLKIRWKELF